MKEDSPFTPGSPVPVELFVGRVDQIKEILKYVNQSASGRQENVFFAGERGIGKSSLAASYKFVNELYLVYIWMENQRFKEISG